MFWISDSFYYNQTEIVAGFLHKKAFTFIALYVNNWHLKQLRRSQDSRNTSFIIVAQGSDTP
jgi:hypothetical protein